MSWVDDLERRIKNLEEQVEPIPLIEGDCYERIHCTNASCARTVAVRHLTGRTIVYHQATYHIEFVPKPGTRVFIPCKRCGVGYRETEPTPAD